MPRHVSAGFRDRLRSAREERGLTQGQLALAIGLSGRASISALEKGRQKATLELCEDLARTLGVDPRWLAYGGRLVKHHAKSTSGTAPAVAGSQEGMVGTDRQSVC